MIELGARTCMRGRGVRTHTGSKTESLSPLSHTHVDTHTDLVCLDRSRTSTITLSVERMLLCMCTLPSGHTRTSLSHRHDDDDHEYSGASHVQLQTPVILSSHLLYFTH